MVPIRRGNHRIVIPAKAGTQRLCFSNAPKTLDSRLRGNDGLPDRSQPRRPNRTCRTPNATPSTARNTP
ncbi:hypothetical protein FQY83_15080 [Luteimonas marina]|uniref:Uncharacterized protein n=1 Tax=Luteimonas marina TaxID=488485 RepID=A0A5C5TZI2_9GAMM|nr:hypothetical protein FQY83_15080 [Luteimonas marina]